MPINGTSGTIVWGCEAKGEAGESGEHAAFLLGARPNDGDRGLTNPGALARAYRLASDGCEEWRDAFNSVGERRIDALREALQALCAKAKRAQIEQQMRTAEERVFVAKNRAAEKAYRDKLNAARSSRCAPAVDATGARFGALVVGAGTQPATQKESAK